jgi:hypothetical protein
VELFDLVPGEGRTRLTVADEPMRSDLNPHRSSPLFGRKIPLMLNERHGLIKPLCPKRGIAGDENEVQSGVLAVVFRIAEPLRHLAHIAVYGNKACLVIYRSYANEIIFCTRVQDVAVLNRGMAAACEDRADRDRGALIEQGDELRQAASL